MTAEELNNSVALVDFVIFGGAGDLAYRKLLPAMYRAYKEGKIDKTSRIYCTVRKEADFENYSKNVHQALNNFLYEGEFDAANWEGFSSMVQAVMVDITTRDEKWANLEQLLQADDDRARVFYLSTPPTVFGICCQNLHDQGLITDKARVVVEKPLGYDAKSAAEINDTIATYFTESQIFRIDHYLGKETVQNLMALRFSNILFEQFWNFLLNLLILPLSINFCFPPVQAACDFGSISSLRTSPSLPQVDLVSNCVPSVISTLIEWFNYTFA